MAEQLGVADRPRVVVIGGGFAGLNVARKLKKTHAQVIVIDKNNHHIFQPLLYQVATAGLSPADITSTLRSTLGPQGNTEVMLGEVTEIDRERRVVKLARCEIAYDYLVVAAGMQNNYFGNEEAWEPHAIGLKTIEEALEIRRRMLLAFEAAEYETDEAERARLLTFVIVGGGPTGVEMAGAIAEIAREVLVEDFRHIDARSARIVLVEGGKRLLSAFSEKSSSFALKELEGRGIEVRLGTFVESIDGEGVVAGGERLESRNIVWSAGLKAVGFASTLEAETDRIGRVLVTPELTIPGDERVYVIGDLAYFPHDERYDGLPGVAPAAIQMGEHAGDNLRRALTGDPLKPFSYFDKGAMATIGRASAVAETSKFKMTGFTAWLAWLFIHVLYLVEFRDRITVIINWAYSYLAFRRSTRLITNESAVLHRSIADYGTSPVPPPARETKSAA